MARSFLLKTAALVSSTLLASSTGAANADPAVVDLVHTSGSNAKIAVFGAQVTSFCTAEDPTVNVLFMSKDGPTDGVNPSRGGITVVFPNYEAITEYNSVPELGFARATKWTLNGVSQQGVFNTDYSSASLSLASSDATRQLWPFDFELRYEVRLYSDRLETKLSVISRGSTGIEFQALLNNHIFAPDVRDYGVVISGLHGVEYIDRVTHTNQTDKDTVFGITSRVDRIYKGFKGSVRAHVKGGNDIVDRDVYIKSTAQFGDGGHTPFFTQADYTLWNPWTEGPVGGVDGAGSDEYLRMVAIGVGGVSEKMMVAPTMSYTVEQVVSVARTPPGYELDW